MMFFMKNYMLFHFLHLRIQMQNFSIIYLEGNLPKVGVMP